jgi:hypothetical protein
MQPVATGESARRGRADPISLHPLSFEKAAKALVAMGCHELIQRIAARPQQRDRDR